jgi:hypothetical protein
MLSEPAPEIVIAGTPSVMGTKLTCDAGPAAFVDFHTPPPVVPTYTVFPPGSEPVSMAILVTRPVTGP